MRTKVYLIIGVIIVVILSGFMYYSYINNSGFEVEFGVTEIRNIKLRETGISPTSTISEDIYKQYEKNWKMDRDSIYDMFKDPKEYVYIMYGVTYSSKKATQNNNEPLLGVFYKALYSNELSKMYVGNELRRDMDLTYIPNKSYSTGISVIVKRNGKSDKEILELAKGVRFKIIGKEAYDENKMVDY